MPNSQAKTYTTFKLSKYTTKIIMQRLLFFLWQIFLFLILTVITQIGCKAVIL